MRRIPFVNTLLKDREFTKKIYIYFSTAAGGDDYDPFENKKTFTSVAESLIEPKIIETMEHKIEKMYKALKEIEKLGSHKLTDLPPYKLLWSVSSVLYNEGKTTKALYFIERALADCKDNDNVIYLDVSFMFQFNLYLIQINFKLIK